MPASLADRLGLTAPLILQEAQAWIAAALEQRLPAESESPAILNTAMRYAMFGGGKRLRPALVREACRACQGTDAECEPFAAALEMIHAYSLIHDDLPCMDDDDLRHGRPTCHRQFGDAIAVLAGDGLLTLAFRQLADLPRADRLGAALKELSDAAGWLGMVGGQVLDIQAADAASTPKKLPAAFNHPTALTVENVLAIHRRKTGALFRAAIVGGAICAGASDEQLAALREFALHVGQSFQIVDDILDETSSPEKMGKGTQKDRGAQKFTYPQAAGGIAPARQDAKQFFAQGLAALTPLGDAAEPLRLLAQFVIDRDH
ncbi:MAG TPA: farnesyl diphosphate synthase [Planctomycetota bacterium]|nr:farnesyl diphosphate synthase [Planctomycetota bacterium]